MLVCSLFLGPGAMAQDCGPKSRHLLGYPEDRLVGVEVWDKKSGKKLGSIVSVSPRGVTPERVLVSPGEEASHFLEEHNMDDLVIGTPSGNR